ncbi:YaaR family protein [Paenibacillus dokdonensis]|uniref:YaaR family protein n=1 Tax=Paenibacillus dokdonensis TaxID=2567944 RepID=A0ABU6GVJ0_9BACL|nr:YaaR family protein [Paenibacillus dokdonensis]MEC0243785.1 YaaR family protein [Paenibacillus dokdonensis]
MKINPGFRPIKSELQVTDGSTKPVQQKSFMDVMQQQSANASQEELGRQFKEIQMQGDRLARAMTIRELKAYRLLVKRFLEDTVRRGVTMKEARGWDRRGRGKRYKLLDEIDSALLGMADEMLDSEQGKIDLLQRIGEIRGMLINLAF